MGIRDRDFCRKHFRELKNPAIKISISLFVINNRHHFEANTEVHNIDT
jgi:hypothetical protein